MHIVRLVEGDADRLRRLRLAALADSPSAFASTYELSIDKSADDWAREFAALATFVAIRDGNDVGMVRGGVDDENERAAWLLSMWVEPRARGRGVGDALVTAVIEWARKRGFATLYLDVGDHNGPAIALYEKHGFDRADDDGALPPPHRGVPEHRRVLRL